MTDPVSLTAGAIAALAFSEFVKSSVGELAKKSVGGTLDLITTLRDKIRTRFQGNDRAMGAIAEVEQHGSETALEKVGKYLDLELVEDEPFAADVRQLAQQIINIQNQTTTFNQQNVNQGRDQFVINQPQGDLRLGG